MSTCNDLLKNDLFPGPIDIKKFEYEFVGENRDTSIDSTDSSQSERRHVPYFLNPYIVPNAGVYLSYFSVGIAMYILQAPLSFYLINYLDISATQYSAYSTLVSLPWSLKFLFGVLSDGVPILGYRRKSWMIIAWLLYVCAAFYLAATGGPDFITTAVLMFLLTCSYLLADVCHDALCVERSRLEFEEIKGLYQTGAYSIRSYGAVIGAVLGAILFNVEYWGWGLSVSQLFVLVGLIPVVTMLPSLWHLEEIKSNSHVPSLADLATDIWNTLQLRAVWYPMIFIYTYYVMQIPNAAWTNFLVEGDVDC
jgi:MFS family permease